MGYFALCKAIVISSFFSPSCPFHLSCNLYHYHIIFHFSGMFCCCMNGKSAGMLPLSRPSKCQLNQTKRASQKALFLGPEKRRTVTAKLWLSSISWPHGYSCKDDVTRNSLGSWWLFFNKVCRCHYRVPNIDTC